jgi:ubiquinone/menaquinone biosynthesis C-methylase UbiE
MAPSSATARKFWSKQSHERAVEDFYSHGAEKYGDSHKGYLNFGLWEDGITNYIEAAENLVRRMGTLMGLRPGCRLLDVGCGMGTQDLFLFRAFGPLEIDAVDVTWKHIEHGLRRACEHNCDDMVRFHHGSAVKLPFPNNSFTNAMSIEGAEHFNTREDFFREAHRVLVPGGVMALADYTMKRPPLNPLEKLIVEGARALWKIPKSNADSKESYQRKLERNGFRKVTIQEVGALTYPGYYFEQISPEWRREVTRIRGFVGGKLGLIVDIAAYRAYKMGLAEYVLVRAEKPV